MILWSFIVAVSGRILSIATMSIATGVPDTVRADFAVCNVVVSRLAIANSVGQRLCGYEISQFAGGRAGGLRHFVGRLA